MSGKAWETWGGRSPIRIEEAALVEKVKEGQTDAYEVLVRRYQDRVFNACWRISGNLEDARDLTQEAFLRAFEGLKNFRHQSSFYTWVFRVAVNLALSHRRKSRRRAAASLDQRSAEGTQADDLAREVSDSGETPSDTADAREQKRLIAKALQSIEEEHRTVLVLRDIEGFAYQDIAEILDVPPGTVKSRLFRARAAMKQAFEALQGGGPTDEAE